MTNFLGVIIPYGTKFYSPCQNCGGQLREEWDGNQKILVCFQCARPHDLEGNLYGKTIGVGTNRRGGLGHVRIKYK